MISVIIPLYNAEETIVKALDSVKNQTFGEKNFEIIVVNDGSTDRSSEIVENYINQNPELNIQQILQENGGVSKARNMAMKQAKGDYFALLDSDDEWLPEKTEKQMKFLMNEKLNIDFIASLRNGISLHFPYSVQKSNLCEITLKKLLLKIEGQTSTAIFKRKVVENTGFFDENQKYSEDANYWMRVSENNKMYIFNENLVIAGDGKRSFGVSGLSANLKEMEEGIQKNIREMYSTKRINFFEYLFFVGFSKVKYFVRIYLR